MRKILSPVRAIILGLILSVIGLVLMAKWGGVEEIQGATSPEEFATVAASIGNQLRLASWSDILVFVPGYTLLVGGVLALFRDPDGAVRRSARIGMGFLGAGVIIDQVENLMVQLGLGRVDLDQPGPSQIVHPSDGLLSVLQIAFVGKFVGLALAIATILGLAVIAAKNRLSTGARPSPDSPSEAG